MKANQRRAYNALKKIGCPVYECADGFRISAEENTDEMIWADYWEGMSIADWAFGVNPIVDAILAKYKLYCEWQNPGELSVWDA